ncbi:hypothetical protein [Streptomyces sp. 3N207]|uniref:hypothetical protein n=1 Tax=Streptomyces sp. 3N207 TaxID=3457417 RepID=UPI003FD4926B
MSATITNGAAQQPQQPAEPPPLTLWSLLILVVVLVLLLIGAGLVYVTWCHPSLATPLQVAVGGVTFLGATIFALTQLMRAGQP